MAILNLPAVTYTRLLPPKSSHLSLGNGRYSSLSSSFLSHGSCFVVKKGALNYQLLAIIWAIKNKNSCRLGKLLIFTIYISIHIHGNIPRALHWIQKALRWLKNSKLTFISMVLHSPFCADEDSSIRNLFNQL